MSSVANDSILDDYLVKDEETEASLAERRRKNMNGIKEIAQASLTYFEKATNGSFY